MRVVVGVVVMWRRTFSRLSRPTRMYETIAMLPSDMREVEREVKALGSRHEVGGGLLSVDGA